jgi:hypothetical protein
MNGAPAIADTVLLNEQRAGQKAPAKNATLSPDHRPPQAPLAAVKSAGLRRLPLAALKTNLYDLSEQR